MTVEMPNYTISKRVRGLWGKFSDWYGADVIAKQFGAIPPQEWCEAIDSIPTRDAMVKVLAEVRAKHVNWPPKFPEFDAIVTKVSRPAITGPSTQDRLCEFAVKNKSLTRAQLAAPWTYLYRGFPGLGGDPKDPRSHASADFAVTGVIIPADGDAPGYRVMVEDMQLGAQAA